MNPEEEQEYQERMGSPEMEHLQYLMENPEATTTTPIGEGLPVKYSELTREERRSVREEYIRLQEGKCFFCKGDLQKEPPKRITKKPIQWEYFPSNFLQYPIHLQHDHDTGMTEGAVHAYCNAVMWQYYQS